MTPEETIAIERDRRLRNAFLKKDFGEATARLDGVGGVVEDAPSFLMRSAVAGWAGSRMGRRVNHASPEWQGIKDGIARGYFKNRAAANVSDEELFGLIAADYQAQDDLLNAAKISAARGESWLGKFRQIQEQGKMPTGREIQYLGMAKQIHDGYRAKIEPYRQTINTVAALATNGEDAANFDAMARELLKVPKDDRPFVIEALASQAPDVIDQGGISNIALTWGRSIERFLSKSGTGIQEMLTPAGNVSEIPLEPETPEEKANREARQKEVEDFRELRDQIRDVANGKLAPIETVRFLGMNISGAIESVPMTMAAFIPYAGPAALIGNFQRETFNELRSTNPTMTREAAQSIATISAPFQALTEVVSDRLLFGKLPSLKRSFTAPAFIASSIAKQAGQRLAVGTAVETGEEFVQGVTPLAVQDTMRTVEGGMMEFKGWITGESKKQIIDALKSDIPGADWQGYFDQFGENLPEMILTILPLAIVGAGTGQLSDFATGRMLATSPQHLTASGYSPEASAEIAAAANSGDWAKAENLMRADWAKVNAKGKAVSEVAGQAAVRVEEARAAQAVAVQEVIAQNKEEETRALAIEEELARRGELPDVMINPQTGKYRVIDREGNILIETDKRADALNVAYSTLEENQRIAAEATVQIFDELMATRGTQAEGAVVSLRKQTAQSIVQEGIVSYDQMMQGAMTAAKADGVSEQQAQIDSSTINGFSRAEYWDQVRTMVSRTFATGGVETAIHETVHNRVRRGMANGTYTREMALEWVRAAERALEGKTDKAGKPIKFLPSENDAEIDDRVLEEAVAELAVADTIGRRKSGTRFTPGLIAQGISARLRADKNAFLGKTKEERATARKGGNLARFKLFLQGWKETLGNMLRIARQVQAARQEGKLGEDFDAFLDNLLGTDAQSRYDLQTQQEAKQLLEDGNMPFSMNRKGGKPSIKTAIEVDGKIHTTTGSHYDATLDYIVRQMPAYQRDDMEAAREKAGEILTNEWLKEHGVKQGFVVDGDFLTREETLAKVKELGIPTPLADEEQRNWFDSQDIEAMQDIRFSSRSMASVLEAALEAQRRNPEFRERLLKLATEKAQAIRQDGPMRVNKRGVVSQRQGMDTMAENDRTKANIEAERKFRLRSRQRELIDQGMLALSPETLAAYYSGVSSLEDVPIVKDMLSKVGKIMSKSTAQRLGKLKTDGVGSAGDYDGAPRLPPSWYAKSGGSMPYEIAQELSDMGHLKDGYADTLWDALRSAIYSTRTANEAFQKARAAVRQVEVDALAQATKEANEWAAKAEAKVPTPKDKQLAALRTLDAILSIFPPEIRGKVGGMYQLAKANTDAAREKEILKRVEIIDQVLEKEGVKLYRAKIKKLFKRYAPKKEAGKKPVGQLEPDAQELVDAASEAMGYDEIRMRAEVSAIDSMLAEEGLSDERETYLERKRELIQLFADYKNADAARLESAADALEATASEGWAKWKLKKIMERERREEARKSLVADTGKPSIGKERDNQNEWAKTTFGKPFSMLLNISSFSELLRFEFGEKSAEARRLEDQERAAAYAYEDAMQAFGDRIGDFFAELAGGRLAGEQLRFDLAQPTLTVGTGDNERTISQLQGIQALLMWQQEDGRRHMEGQLDESGKPVGSWHYGEEWVKDLESKMTPEAYQVKAFLEQLYSEEYPALNALYRQRHGVNLPKNPLYSPLTVQPMQADAGEMVDPVSGFIVKGSILTPGGLRTRNKRAVAEPRFEDAVQIFLGHSRQMEHWKAYYDFAMDAQAILLNREVTNAVESKGSKQAVAVLKKWVDQFAQGGSRDAQAGLEISNTYNRLASRTARIALFGKVPTLLIQSVQLAAASVKMPVGSYIKRFGMLMSGNLDYIDAIKSPFMQRRYKSAPPIVQQALADVGDTKRPNFFSSTTPRFLGNLLSGADALFTGGTYAMLLDYHRTVTGPALGLQGAELESFAQKEAERDTEAVAQPVRSGTKSIFENTLPIWARGGFSFASEARQKITLAAWAAYKAKSDPTQAAKVAFLTFIVGGLVTQVIKNLWREAKGDDDEKMWSAERLTKATLAGPLHGIPGVSELMGDPGLFSGFKWSAGAVEKIATKAMEDDLDEVTMRDMENALSAAGYFNDTAAGIAGISHLGFDFAKILQTLAEEE
jgi:hypothetical protein